MVKPQLKLHWSVLFAPSVAFYCMLATLVVVTSIFYAKDDCKENDITLDQQQISDYLCCYPERWVGLAGLILTGCGVLVSSFAVWKLLEMTFPTRTHINGTCAALLALSGVGMIGVGIFTVCSYRIVHYVFAEMAFVLGCVATVLYNCSFVVGPAVIPNPETPVALQWVQSMTARCVLMVLMVCTTCYYGAGILYTEWGSVLMGAFQVGAVVQVDLLYPPPLGPDREEYEELSTDENGGGGGVEVAAGRR